MWLVSWLPSISPPNLGLIGSLTTDIYHRTEITGNAYRHAQKLNVTLGQVKKVVRLE